MLHYVAAFNGTIDQAKTDNSGILTYAAANEIMMINMYGKNSICISYYRYFKCRWCQHDTEKPVSIYFQPALTNSYVEQWRVDDQLHRVDGPAFIVADENNIRTNSYILEGTFIYNDIDGKLISRPQDKEKYEQLCQRLKNDQSIELEKLERLK